MTLEEKIDFIKVQTPRLLQELRAKTSPWWGKMNAHQMIEHLTMALQNSTEKVLFNISTPLDKLEQAKQFLMSDKEMRPDTKHPNLAETPAPAKTAHIGEAFEQFTEELKHFFEFFDAPGKQTIHPAFGSLNFEEWVQCHYKHFVHHLRQFDLMK